MRLNFVHMFVAALCFSLSPFTVQAKDINTVSRIKSVVLYSDGAQITRSFEVDTFAGNSTLVVADLPSTIDPASIRLEGMGNGKLNILSVDIKATPGKPNASADPELNLKIEILKAEREVLQGSIEAFELQKTTIQRFADAGPDALKSDGKIVDSSEWSKSWIVLSDGMQKTNEKLLNLRSNAKRLDAEISALVNATSADLKRVSPVYEARINVEAGGVFKASLNLVYQVRGAGWTPIYDAKLISDGVDKPRLDFTRRAQIVQRTGEDWQDVNLQLSTVRLQRLTAAPAVLTATLNLIDPSVVMSQLERSLSKASAPVAAAPIGRVQNGFAEDSARRKDKSETEEPMAAIEIGAGVEASAYQAIFIVPGKVTVPKDGVQKTFALGTQALEPDVSLKSSPSLDQTAYLEASFIHIEDAPLLAGQVMIYRDGIFVGRDNLKFTSSGDKASLGFGADDAVKIIRIPVKKRENDAGFWGNTRVDVQDFKTTAKNLHKFPVKLTIVDRIPVSENTAVIVEALSTNTPPTEKAIEDKRGVMSWVYDVNPAESRDVRLGWRVKWPADRELSTFNRGR